MSESIDNMRMEVVKVVETDAGEKSGVTVTLKGLQTIAVQDKQGYALSDTLEVSLTVKCGIMATADELGIARYMATKMLVLRDRDMSLESFSKIPEAVQKEIV